MKFSYENILVIIWSAAPEPALYKHLNTFGGGVGWSPPI